MNIQFARALAALLSKSADAAEVAGKQEIELPSSLSALRQVDAAARAKLEAAIQEALAKRA
jgi:hypothetical protein